MTAVHVVSNGYNCWCVQLARRQSTSERPSKWTVWGWPQWSHADHTLPPPPLKTPQGKPLDSSPALHPLSPGGGAGCHHITCATSCMPLVVYWYCNNPQLLHAGLSSPQSNPPPPSLYPLRDRLLVTGGVRATKLNGKGGKWGSTPAKGGRGEF